MFTVAFAVLGCSQLSADTLTLSANDTGIANDGSGNLSLVDTTNYQVRIGEFFAPGGETYIMPFQLPTLAAGQAILTAQLQTQLFGLVDAGNLANADLYGIGVTGTPTVSSTPTVLTSFYFQGPSDPNNTLIQGSFLTPSSTVRTDANTGPFTDTSAAGDLALATFLNTAYAGGANAGKWVFLRVSYDLATIPPGNSAYSLLTQDAGGANEKPILTYTFGLAAVPEPSSYLMIGAGLSVLVVMLRRRAVGARL
jgi:hypothetical protein